MNNPFAQQPKPTTMWIWQAITGTLLVFLLGLHFVANHFIAQGGLRNYSDVVAYLHNPVILVLEASFLAVVTSHALLGVRSILLDFGLSHHTARLLNRSLMVLGVLTLAYGVWLTWVIIR